MFPPLQKDRPGCSLQLTPSEGRSVEKLLPRFLWTLSPVQKKPKEQMAAVGSPWARPWAELSVWTLASDLSIPSGEGISWPHLSVQGLGIVVSSWCVICHLPGKARSTVDSVPRSSRNPGSICLPTRRLWGVRGNTGFALSERISQSWLLGTEASRQVASASG